eukprot:tig00000241_g21043.t1
MAARDRPSSPTPTRPRAAAMACEVSEAGRRDDYSDGDGMPETMAGRGEASCSSSALPLRSLRHDGRQWGRVLPTVFDLATPAVVKDEAVDDMRDYWAAEDSLFDFYAGLRELPDERMRELLKIQLEGREHRSRRRLPFVLQRIPRVGDYSDEKFLKLSVERNEPVIFSNAIKIPDVSKWSNDSLQSQLEAKGVRELIVRNLVTRATHRQSPAEFFGRMRAAGKSEAREEAEPNLFYMPDFDVDNILPEIGEQVIKVPGVMDNRSLENLFRYFGKVFVPVHRLAYMGPRLTHTGLHIDACGTYAWNTTIRGRKLFMIWPAHKAAAMREEPLLAHEIYDRFPPTFVPMEVFARCGILPRVALLRPGETLIIPGGCPHQVLNLEESVAVAADFLPVERIPEALSKLQIDRALGMGEKSVIAVKKMCYNFALSVLEHAKRCADACDEEKRGQLRRWARLAADAMAVILGEEGEYNPVIVRDWEAAGLGPPPLALSVPPTPVKREGAGTPTRPGTPGDAAASPCESRRMREAASALSALFNSAADAAGGPGGLGRAPGMMGMGRCPDAGGDRLECNACRTELFNTHVHCLECGESEAPRAGRPRRAAAAAARSRAWAFAGLRATKSRIESLGGEGPAPAAAPQEAPEREPEEEAEEEGQIDLCVQCHRAFEWYSTREALVSGESARGVPPRHQPNHYVVVRARVPLERLRSVTAALERLAEAVQDPAWTRADLAWLRAVETDPPPAPEHEPHADGSILHDEIVDESYLTTYMRRLPDVKSRIVKKLSTRDGGPEALRRKGKGKEWLTPEARGEPFLGTDVSCGELVEGIKRVLPTRAQVEDLYESVLAVDIRPAKRSRDEVADRLVSKCQESAALAEALLRTLRREHPGAASDPDEAAAAAAAEAMLIEEAEADPSSPATWTASAASAGGPAGRAPTGAPPGGSGRRARARGRARG